MTFSSLQRNQKEAIGLLSIGTFLEYFDLMLYVHMAVLLNDLFFPKTDPFTASLLSALAFTSTYLLRPFGALIFGYIGDNIGRKATVILTTSTMALCCLAIANLPTYQEIGIAAAWIMIGCRMLQGLSSLGEITGAELYVTEMTKPPLQYVAVGLVSVCTLFGGLAALGFAMICTKYMLNWRIAFWGGACVAIIGAIARTRLKETSEFLNAKKIKEKINKHNSQKLNQLIKKHPIYNEKVNQKNSLAYLFLLFGWPAYFFLIYIYCGNLFKTNFGYTGAQVIANNFFVVLINGALVIFLIFLSRKVHPLKILKTRIIIALMAIPFTLFLLSKIHTPQQLFLMQLLFVFTSICFDPVSPVVYKNFPVLKRFTYSSIIHAVSKIVVYVITSFGMVYVTKNFEYYGILLIIVPIGLLFYWGVLHFLKIEQLR